MKTAGYLLGCVYLGFAVVQLNDPDPWRWFAVYLVAGCICIASVHRLLPPIITVTVALIAIAWAGGLIIIMTDLHDSQRAELLREIAGLGVVASGLLMMNYLNNRRQRLRP